MVRLMLKILKIFAKYFAIFLILLLLIFGVNYITCPVYDFHVSTPFSGLFIYNPYSSMDSKAWHKSNFQIQSYAWGGITSGRGNSNEDIYQLYKSLGYEVIATSDYQKINRFAEQYPGFIPVYEHGYGIQKSHQVLVGSKKVLWKDYPFFQTIHNKQHIIKSSFSRDGELIKVQ